MGMYETSLALVCFSVSNPSFESGNPPQDYPFESGNSLQDYLSAHNAARAQVGVGPMTWNDTVAAYALGYANSKGDCELIHLGVSSSRPYGENLAEGSGSFTGTDAMNLWVGEKPGYDYNNNSCVGGKQCLHYTQEVWRNSVHLGCARIQCNNGWWYVICNYYPPGNNHGQRPY